MSEIASFKFSILLQTVQQMSLFSSLMKIETLKKERFEVDFYLRLYYYQTKVENREIFMGIYCKRF